MNYLVFAGLVLGTLTTSAQNSFWADGPTDPGSFSYKNNWSIEENQAGLMEATHFMATTGYYAPFLLRELSSSTAGVILPTESGVFALSARRDGPVQFSRSSYTLAYAKSLNPQFAVGIQFRKTTFRVEQNRYAAWSVGGGFQMNFNDQLHASIHFYNPNQSRLRGGVSKLPSWIKGGIHYAYSENTQILLEVRKQSDQKPQIRTGLIYQASDSFLFALGMTTQPGKLFTRVGFHFGKADLILSHFYHNTLGSSPQITLVYHAP